MAKQNSWSDLGKVGIWFEWVLYVAIWSPERSYTDGALESIRVQLPVSRLIRRDLHAVVAQVRIWLRVTGRSAFSRLKPSRTQPSWKANPPLDMFFSVAGFLCFHFHFLPLNFFKRSIFDFHRPSHVITHAPVSQEGSFEKFQLSTVICSEIPLCLSLMLGPL